MLQPLVVGLGRSGSGLHLRTLSRLAGRSRTPGDDALVALPAVGCDPRAGLLRLTAPADEVTVVTSLEQALDHVDPATTVTHVCTPPRQRYTLVEQLARHGLRRVILEKPLAGSREELDALVRLRDEADLHLVAVAHWTTSRLAHRLRRIVRDGRLGPLRRITVDQHKPRFLRSLTTDGHRSALDVEIPHSLALALDLAGPADLRAAHCWDLRCEDRELPGMGGARLELEHRSGVTTLLRSDLGAPVRQRSVVCEFDGGTATAHFPLSEDDDHAQMVVTPFDGDAPPPVGGDAHPPSGGDTHPPCGGDPRLPFGGGVPAPAGVPAAEDAYGPGRHVFRDDALTDFLAAAYRGFAAEEADTANFSLACATARLLCEARDHCATTAPACAGSR
ncbi:Gfo/Idh/MocA family protein [Streptomyces mexicanus]|uniref:Gfo/Idh/MocA family protein n=1 Tax=Streptomyces mexicanus TaxID=178566 RepID=UPI0036D18B2D